jgi:putative DNA primase/helicase
MRYLKISYSRLLKGIEHDACMFRTFKASNIQPVSKSSCPELRDRYERQFAQALSCVPGDEVYTYLQTTRQLQLRVVPDSIKLCRNMPYYDLDENNELYVAGSYPVLLTALRGVDGLIVALGRLYLSGDGTKAPVLKPKKLTRAVAPGACSGASVQLFPVGKTLIVTEGLETALACHVATGYPAWACWSAPGLAAFEPPKEVETLLICGDNDSNKVGQRAAAKLADRMHAQGVRTKILIPSKPDTDWLDALLKNGGIEA